MISEINYHIKGEGSPLVFLHGLGADSNQILDLLEPENFKLITSDARGHGKSRIGSKTISFNQYADDIIDIMNTENIRRAVFGGLSMGAGIAINAAIRYPERVSGLILLRPAWLCEKNPANLHILLDIAEHLQAGKSKEEFVDHPELSKIRSVLPAAAHSIEGMFSRMPAETTPVILKEMVSDQPCVPGEEAKINVPVLVIGNDDDPLHPYFMAETWAKLLRGELRKVPSRYVQANDHKRDVNNEINRFIRKLKTT